MKWKTDIQLPTYDYRISHETPLVTMGSCFSAEVGAKLHDWRLPMAISQGGTLFNPVSICRVIQAAIEARPPNEQKYIQQGAHFFHFDYHSSFYAADEASLRAEIDGFGKELKAKLTQAKVLIITLGTAWIHAFSADNEVVANCHKAPNHLFNKRILSFAELKEAFVMIEKALLAHNPELRLLYTLSPVRHIKEGLIENQQSKSLLRAALGEYIAQTKSADYFPSYEIMMDELRDYRYYKEDMIHPTQQAVDYISDQFAAAFFEPHTIHTIKTWRKLKAALGHRPLHQGREEQIGFLQSVKDKLEKLQPQAAFAADLDLANERIATLSSQAKKPK
ncbi:MAG: GSCFA domain-containing protein [Cyclobacteriaceae bacterium]|nr:GSCFA domain-containing protein [Cyclobacteriaceae bacterium]MCH8515457.1 GSCFA domain-containing protein [Cyclobacteriaceae bacterium]